MVQIETTATTTTMTTTTANTTTIGTSTTSPFATRKSLSSYLTDLLKVTSSTTTLKDESNTTTTNHNNNISLSLLIHIYHSLFERDVTCGGMLYDFSISNHHDEITTTTTTIDDKNDINDVGNAAKSTSSSPNITFLEETLLRQQHNNTIILTQEEYQVCESILSTKDDDDSNDRCKLLVIQFILFAWKQRSCIPSSLSTTTTSTTTTTSPLLSLATIQGIIKILIPYLLLSDDDDNLKEEDDSTTDNSNNRTTTIPPPSLNLSMALIDLLEQQIVLILSTTNTTNTTASTTVVVRPQQEELQLQHNDTVDVMDVGSNYGITILQMLNNSFHPNASMAIVRLLQITIIQSSTISSYYYFWTLNDIFNVFFERVWKFIIQAAAAAAATAETTTTTVTTSTIHKRMHNTTKTQQQQHHDSRKDTTITTTTLLASLSKQLLLPFMELVLNLQNNNNKYTTRNNNNNHQQQQQQQYPHKKGTNTNNNNSSNRRQQQQQVDDGNHDNKKKNSTTKEEIDVVLPTSSITTAWLRSEPIYRHHMIQFWQSLLEWVHYQQEQQPVDNDVFSTTQSPITQGHSHHHIVQQCQRQQQQQNILLIATTVLCPLFPQLLLFPPSPHHSITDEKMNNRAFLLSSNNNNNNNNRRQVEEEVKEQQKQLQLCQWQWQLIHACLAQGRWSSSIIIKDCTTMWSDTTSTTGSSAAIDSILRRRGLYLLDTLLLATPATMTTTDNKDHVPAASSLSCLSCSCLSCSPLLKIWKDYVLCYETFEMESERHIIDQVWSVVVSLIQHVAATTTTTSTTLSASTVAAGLPTTSSTISMKDENNYANNDGPGEDDENPKNEMDGCVGVGCFRYRLTTDWILLLLGRLMSSEQFAIRKLGLFRLLQVLGRDEEDEAKEEEITTSSSSFLKSTMTTDTTETKKEDDKEETVNVNVTSSVPTFHKKEHEPAHDVTQQQSQSMATSDTSAPLELGETTATTTTTVAATAASEGTTTSRQSKKYKKKMQKKQKGLQQQKTSITTPLGGSANPPTRNNTKNKRDKKVVRTLEELPTTLLIEILSAESFLWDVMVPAFDSLGGSSVGYTMHLQENNNKKHVVKVPMVPLFEKMVQNYAFLVPSRRDDEYAFQFWRGLWDYDRLLRHLSIKTILLLYESVTCGIEHSAQERSIPMTNEDFSTIYMSFSKLFMDTAVVLTQRRRLLNCLARLLAHSRLPKVPSIKPSNHQWTPLSVLLIMSLFSPSFFSVEKENWAMKDETTFVALAKWIDQLQHQNPRHCDYTESIGATLASAFVSGQLDLPVLGSESSPSSSHSPWDPMEGYSEQVQGMAWAVTLYCTLTVFENPSKSASALLWPAIHKGLSITGLAVLGGDPEKVNIVVRAILLLEFGCKLRVLSGLGHGDLVVVDPMTRQIMPPPPSIEMMLQNVSNFLQWQVRNLLSLENHEESAGGTRSKGARRLASTYASLIVKLKTFHQSYPSSLALSGAMNDLLTTSYGGLMEQEQDRETSDDVRTIMLAGLMFAALSSFADPGKGKRLSMCRGVMKISLSGKSTNASKCWKQSARSMLQYSKWGSCSCLIPLILSELDDATDKQREETKRLVEEVLNDGIDSVTMTPSDALRPLFDCIIATATQWSRTAIAYSCHQGEISYSKTLRRVIDALLLLLEESSVSSQSVYFLNEVCAFIFHPKRMEEEYNHLLKDSACDTPIRDAFRNLIEMSGTQRPHVSRAVLCRAVVGWEGMPAEGSKRGSTVMSGLNAIPYRDDIIKLLQHKESRQDESSANQSADNLPAPGVKQIPENTNELSISRTFVLCFFEDLPEPGKGLNEKVKTELLHYVLLQLLESIKSDGSTNPNAVMRGTPAYCTKMRAWQALVIMSRFVTDEIAVAVCQMVFAALADHLHSQIRYFVEMFIVQCARRHSDLFGKALVDDIARTDLSLQHVSSLMILGGNFLLGKHPLDYFDNDADHSRLKHVLASIIPWLSSPQSFSRGIAQVMVYELIPRVVDGLESNATPSLESKDWYLQVTYNFLDQNKEMKRLREKQTKWFEEYNADDGRLNYILSIPVDEADEPNPVHVIDAMKETLKLTYEETHSDDVPEWKLINQWKAEHALLKEAESQEDDDRDKNGASTLQRKIIPLDSLNLALEDLREQRQSNAMGTHKQPLIVCASLVDKIPNLGGLARTSEIFAAQSLIVPDRNVVKLDDFEFMSVGAGDWLDIDEVKEEDLLLWLLQKRSQGYWIVGLEQTSSSVPLQDLQMPKNRPTVILLGKEKEGIPVPFLAAIDQCIEIPQFGMIRSLNVHVSGAIAIWEFTRQTRLF